MQLGKMPKTNDDTRLHLPSLHLRPQVRSTGDDHRARSFARQDRRGLANIFRSAKFEVGKSQHGYSPFRVYSGCDEALPSPPSHGGRMNTGSRYSIAGNDFGPYRPSLPCDFAFRAFNIFSGVTGISSMRTPTASYTALQTEIGRAHV